MTHCASFITFGWHDAHLHEFEIDDKTYVMVDVEDVLKFKKPKKTFDDQKVKLEKVAYQDSRFVYKYDFGDCWNHEVVAEKIDIVKAEPDGCLYRRRSTCMPAGRRWRATRISEVP